MSSLVCGLGGEGAGPGAVPAGASWGYLCRTREDARECQPGAVPAVAGTGQEAAVKVAMDGEGALRTIERIAREIQRAAARRQATAGVRAGGPS